MRWQMRKITAVLLIVATLFTACRNGSSNDPTEGYPEYSELLHYEEALKIFAEGTTAEVFDIQSGITYKVQRVVGGYDTVANVEALTASDTEKLLQTAGGVWNIRRRSVIVTIGDRKIAASISPLEHSGSASKPILSVISGNNMNGVVDIHFFDSLIPGTKKVDNRHQEMVERAYYYDE